MHETSVVTSEYHVVSLATAAEAAAFVAALSRFLNYPQGDEYQAQPTAVAVWSRPTAIGETVELYLSADAVKAATTAFGPVSVAERRESLPADCKLILENHQTPSWGMSEALRHLTTLPDFLVSNGYTLSNAPNRLGRLIASDPSRPRRELWEQFRRQGYLWLRGLLDRKDVLALRARYFELMREAGIVAATTEAVEGIYSGQPDQTGLTRKLMAEFVRDAAYEAFCLSPRFWRLYEEFLEGPVYLHKRKIIRHTIPHDPNCTGAHYDLVYLRAGTDRVCTSWIPLGDIPVEMGGLVYLEGSDAMGRKFEAEFAAKNADLPPEERINAFNKNMGETGWLTKNLPHLAERFSTRWLIADYEAGDMMIHSAYMIHAATTNQNSHGRMRLSTDIRYQRLRDEIDARWQNHWSFDDML